MSGLGKAGLCGQTCEGSDAGFLRQLISRSGNWGSQVGTLTCVEGAGCVS